MTVSTVVNRAVTVALAGALGLGAVAPTATSSWAAPVLSNAALVRAAAPDHVTDVRWRRGPGIGAAIVGGIILGGIAAAAANSNRYYDAPAPYYGPTYYAPAYQDYGPAYDAPPAVVYAPAPQVYAPAPQYYAPQPQVYAPARQCWMRTDGYGRYGYWQAC